MDRNRLYEDDTPTPPPLYAYPTKSEPRQQGSGRSIKPIKVVRILLIEDNPGDAGLIQASLAEVPSATFQLQHAETLMSGLKILERGNVDLVLLDLSLPPESSGINSLLRVQAAAPTVPIIVLTGLDNETAALMAVQEGAQDYLVKGHVSSALLVRSIRYALERHRRRQAERALRANKEEFRVAQEIQRKLFPAAPPALNGFDIGGASFPAEATGGDYFDYVRMADGSYAIVVGDVAGHGFGPALLMAEVRAYLRSLAWTHADVHAILALANRLLIEDVSHDHFVTLFLGRLDARKRTFTYSSAGHPEGYILDAAGNVKRELKSTGLPLGVDKTAVFASSPIIKLNPGDMVFILTDGVFEALSLTDEPFKIGRVLETVRDHRHESAQRIVDSLYDSIIEYCRGQKLHDDITAIVIKVLTGV